MGKKTRIVVGVIAAALIAAVIIVLCTLSGTKQYDYNLEDYVKVGKYKGVEVQKQPVEKVPYKEVKKKLHQARLDAATTKAKKSGVVESGDICNIDYEGKIDGKTFDGGTAQGASATAGKTDKYIEGFEKGLIGMKIGESKDLNLKFPSDYGESTLAGKDVVFKVTVNSVDVNIVPKFNDEFVKKNTEYDTVEEFREGVRKELEDEAKESAESQERNEAWSKVVTEAEVKRYPKDEMARAKAAAKESLESYAAQSGSDLETFRAQMGLSKDKDFKNYIKQQAETTVKNELVLYYIARKEGIELDVDPKDELKKLIEDAGYDDSTFEAQYGMGVSEYVDEHAAEYEVSLLSEKVSDFVYSKAKIVEKNKN